MIEYRLHSDTCSVWMEGMCQSDCDCDGPTLLRDVKTELALWGHVDVFGAKYLYTLSKRLDGQEFPKSE